MNLIIFIAAFIGLGFLIYGQYKYDCKQSIILNAIWEKEKAAAKKKKNS